MYARKHLISTVVGAAGVAGLAVGALAPVAAAAAAVPTCQLTVHSNKVLNLEDNGANDEIFFRLGDQPDASAAVRAEPAATQHRLGSRARSFPLTLHS